jgi:hypothetical protein
MAPASALGEEPRGAAIHRLFPRQSRHGVDVAAEAELLVFRRSDHSGTPSAKAFRHCRDIVADRGDDAHSGDDNTPHALPLFLAPL